MYDAPTDIELIARHHIHSRTHRSPQLPSPRRRRRQLAGQLRRAADRLDG